jgi:hypothetical protein
VNTPAWIEALSTLGLVILTGAYVVLAWRQTDVSRRQTEYLQGQEQRAAQHARATLWARATFLRQEFSRLPEQMEPATLPLAGWREQDERAIEEAASSFGAGEMKLATEAARGLELLRKQCATVQAGRFHQGGPFALEQLTPNMWQETHNKVLRALQLLETRSKPHEAPAST